MTTSPPGQEGRQLGLPLASSSAQVVAGFSRTDLIDAGVQGARGCLLGAGLPPARMKDILAQASEVIGVGLDAANAQVLLAAVLQRTYDSGKDRSNAIAEAADQLGDAAAKDAARALARSELSGRKRMRADFAEAVRHGVRNKIRVLLR